MNLEFVYALWGSVWGENSWPGRLIILLILVLSARAWVSGKRALSRFRWEERQLESVMKEFDLLRASGTEQSSADAPSASAVLETVNVEALQEVAHMESLAHQRLAAIGQLRRHHVKVNLHTLQGLARAWVASRNNLEASFRGSSQAMMLGILGTFLGLAAMVQQIQWALPADDGAMTLESWTQGFQNVSAVMGGIKTAFSSSLIGMTAALLLTRLDYRLRDRISSFFEKFERFTVERLLPATVPALEDESLMEQVSFQMERSFDRLSEVFEHNEGVLERLTGVQGSYLEILDSIRAIHRSDAAKEFEDVAAGLADTHRSVLQVVENLPQIVDAIETSQSKFLERLSPGRLVVTGLVNLWTARLPGGIQGSLVLIGLAVAFVIVVTITFF